MKFAYIIIRIKKETACIIQDKGLSPKFGIRPSKYPYRSASIIRSNSAAGTGLEYR